MNVQTCKVIPRGVVPPTPRTQQQPSRENRRWLCGPRRPPPPPSSTGDDLQNGGSARLVRDWGTGVNPPRGIHHRRADRGRDPSRNIKLLIILILLLYSQFLFVFSSHLWPMGLNFTILHVVTKYSPVHALRIFIAMQVQHTLTTCQPTVEFHLLTFSRFPLRKKEKKQNLTLTRIELTTSALLAGVQVTY